MNAFSSDAIDQGQRLREILDSEETLLLPGVADALTARIVEDLGYRAAFATGAGIANRIHGTPDLGLVSMTEALTAIGHIVGVSDLPIVADADTGFGGPLNVFRTVRELKRIGVAAVQLEDQEDPKRCGHFDGKRVVATELMVAKIKAAVEARADSNILLIARTDARAVEGFEHAIDRANEYKNAGADILFVEAPQTLEELEQLPKMVDAPLIANMVEGGRTPVVSVSTLNSMGYQIALFANTALRASIMATQEIMRELLREGSSDSVLERLVDWDERQRLVGFPEMERIAVQFGGYETTSLISADSIIEDRTE